MIVVRETVLSGGRNKGVFLAWRRLIAVDVLDRKKTYSYLLLASWQ